MKKRSIKKGAILLITSMTLSMAALLMAGLSTYVLTSINGQNVSVKRNEDLLELKYSLNSLYAYTVSYPLNYRYETQVDYIRSQGFINDKERSVLVGIFGNTAPVKGGTNGWLYVWSNGTNGNRFYQKVDDYYLGHYNIYYCEIYGANRVSYALASINFTDYYNPKINYEIRDIE